MNLLENVKWTEWSPRKELSPEFFIDGDKLSIKTSDNIALYGKFLSSEVYINSPVVIFEAGFSCGNVENEEKCIFAMINFYNSEKKLLKTEQLYSKSCVHQSSTMSTALTGAPSHPPILTGKAHSMYSPSSTPSSTTFSTTAIPGAMIV